MYARVTTANVQPGKMDEAISMMRDSAYPANKNQQGFKSAILLTNPKTGKALSITLWETEAGATAQPAANNPATAGLLVSRSVREIFEVSVQV